MTTNHASEARGTDRRPPTLVFIHGTNSSSTWITGLLAELTLRGHRSVAVDLPGHGREAFYPARTRHLRTSSRWRPSRRRSPRSPSTTTSSASWTWYAAPAATAP
ncbi:alpha/beta fold hydrolase [Nonomuraea antimicrobica]